MNREAGAYIEKDGVITPDLSDEAMAGRQQKEEKSKKAKPAPETAPAEVTNAEK